MQINPIILEKIKSNNNMITTAQVMELGFSRTILSKYVKAGLLERSRQGIYVLSDSVHDDMCTLMMRSDKIVFSHDRENDKTITGWLDMFDKLEHI